MIRITAHSHDPGTGEFLSPVSSCANLPPEALLDWLVFSTSTLTPSSTKVTWDLNRFVRAVLKLLPESVSLELSQPAHRARCGNHKLFFISEKVFSVNKNGSEANFYDLGQYFPGDEEPSLIDDVQLKAEQLQSALTELGITNPPSLASPVACFRGHPVLNGIDTSSIFDVPASLLDAYEAAARANPGTSSHADYSPEQLANYLMLDDFIVDKQVGYQAKR
jgi:hypothetical protein